MTALAIYYTRDSHGNITSLGSGSYAYDAFGNETEDNSTNENLFRCCGEYYLDIFIYTKFYYIKIISKIGKVDNLGN